VGPGGGLVSDGPKDWTEELIGREDGGEREWPGFLGLVAPLVGEEDAKRRTWAGLLELIAPLAWLEPPADLEASAHTLEKMSAAAGGSGRMDDTAEWLRALAELGRQCLRTVEEHGLEWSWPERALRFPGASGRAPKHIPIIAAAKQLGMSSKLVQYDRESLDAIRARLQGLVPAEHLTRSKVRNVLKRWAQASAGSSD